MSNQKLFPEYNLLQFDQDDQTTLDYQKNSPLELKPSYNNLDKCNTIESHNKNLNKEAYEQSSGGHHERHTQIIRDFLFLANSLSEGTFIIDQNGLVKCANRAGILVIKAAGANKPALYIHELLSVLDSSEEQNSSHASPLQKLLSTRDSREKGQKVLFSISNNTPKIKGTAKVSTLAKSLQRAFHASFLVTLTPNGDSIQESAEKRLLEEQLFRAQKVELLGQMASGIAHDFNNLLTAINGNIEALQNESDPSNISDRLRDAEIACSRARELVRSLLSLGRPSPVALRPVSISQIVKEAISITRASIDSRVAITTFLLPPEQALIEGDSGQLNQVIINLLLNARDAIIQRMAWENSANHSIEVTVTSKVIGFSHHVVLRVCDTGVGIKNNIINHIFEPFFTTKEDGLGTGLGLAMVSGIINRHNGSISVHNRPSPAQNKFDDSKLPNHGINNFDSGGCIIEVLFPKFSDQSLRETFYPKLDSDKEEVTKIFLSPQESHSSGRQFKTETSTSTLVNGQESVRGSETILLVEDEAIVREALVKMLKALGYRVHSATDAANGLTLFRQFHREINLVFSDYSMPDMTGVELFSSVRAISPKVPLILSSGNYEEPESTSKSASKSLTSPRGGNDIFPSNSVSDSKSAKHDPTEDDRTYVILSKPFTFNELALAIRQSLDTSN